MGQTIAKLLKNYSIIFLILLIIFTPFTIIKVESSVTFAPIIIESSVNPTKAQPGDVMTVSVSVTDLFGVNSVKARFFHEHGSDVINLSLVSGTIFRGVWEGQWIVHDTLIKEYWTLISVVSQSGGFSSVNLSWFDPAPWWDINWSYRREINISENSGSSLENYQVLVTLNTQSLISAGKMKEDCADIRFIDSDGSTKLNYWIEGGCNTSLTKIWVKIPEILASSNNTIYVYYGNPNAESENNGDSTFEFFDEFNGTNLNNTKWDYDGFGGYSNIFYSINNGFLEVWSNNDWRILRMIKSFAPQDKIITETKFKTDGVSYWHQNYLVQETSVNRNRFGLQDNGGLGWRVQYKIDDGSWLYSGVLYTITSNVWFIDAIQKQSTNTFKAIIYDTQYNQLGGSFTYTTSQWADETWTWVCWKYSATKGYFDWVRVRKYANPEPNITVIGEEEIAVPTKPILTSPENNKYLNNNKPTFEWNNGKYHENNTLYVSNKYDFSEEYIKISLSPYTSSYVTPDGKTLSEGRWYWKVVANNPQGTNSSEIWSFIVDITPPNQVNLNSPANGYASDSNSVTFSWYATTDNTTNTSQVSNLAYYNLQVDENQNFLSPMINENTQDNTTLSLTKTLTGHLYWRVRAVDNAGNAGDFSEIRNLTIFNFSLKASAEYLQILRGATSSISLTITRIYGDDENVTLSYEWIGLEPNGVTIFLTNDNNKTDFSSTMSFQTSGDADTGDFICRINAISYSGITKSLDIHIGIIGMSYLVLANPSSISMIRSEIDKSTVSVIFMMGAKYSVMLSGSWLGDKPEGISVNINPSNGIPSYESTINFNTDSNASVGEFIYRVTSIGGGLTQWADINVEVKVALNITVDTDKKAYEKGESIQISGTAKDPKNNLVKSGTANINITAQNYSYYINTSITNGIYNTSFYITFDKPEGNWNISVTATDTNGHETISPQKTSIFVKSPEIYEQYSINILGPTAGQVFKRGEIVTFTISLTNINNEKIQSAEIKAILENNQILIFSEESPGIYSTNYELGYDFTLGNSRIYIEAKKYENEKLKVGFNFIDFKVSSISFIIKLVEIKPGDLIEIGETINIKLEALYPNGSPVENSVIKAVGPNGMELLFSKSKSERGIYTTSYITAEGDIGNWVINVDVEDAYGNYYKGEIINIEIVHIKTLSYLLRYWWITALVIIIMASFTSYIGCKKLDRIKIRKLKDEILELKKLKEKNAIFYYLDYSIDRETYENLSQVYESKIANLSKKLRILEKKFENKKGKRNGDKKKFK